MLLLLCGDLESNLRPSPKGYKVCPNCSKQVPVTIHLQGVLRERPEKLASRFPVDYLQGLLRLKDLKYTKDTVNKVSIGPSTIPESQDDITSINEETMVLDIAMQICFDSNFQLQECVIVVGICCGPEQIIVILAQWIQI